MKALLVSLAVFITSFIVVYTKIDFGFLSIVTAFVLMQLFFTELTKKSIERIFGPVIAAFLILVVMTVFKSHLILMIISSSILLFVFIYFYSAGYFPYSMILGAITIALISSFDVSQSLHDAMQLGIYWVLNLLIGSGTVIVIDFFIRKKHNIQVIKKPAIKKFQLSAVIVASRVVITYVCILLLNRYMGWQFIDIQAQIAGVIIAAQPSIDLSRQRGYMRLLGVFFGAILSILFALMLQHYYSPLLTVIFITVSLGLLTLLSEKYHFWEYAFLQAGVMIPLILITSGQQTINVSLAMERSLGSLEGAIIAILLVYLSIFFLNTKTHDQMN